MKIAIVTGASSGMGREMVYQLADRFGGLSEIWVIARRKDRLEKLAGDVPVKIRMFPLDLSKAEDLEKLNQALIERKPMVRILVNAAGFGRTGTIGSISQKDSLGMVRLNCEALVAVTEMVLPYLSSGSRIIQFASAAAFLPQPGFGVYAATKSFVLSYSRALAKELKSKRIYVTAVCPGTVNTEFLPDALNGKELAPYKKLVLSKPKAVAKLAVSDSLKGKELSVYGPFMKGFRLLCKLLPHSLIMRFIRW